MLKNFLLLIIMILIAMIFFYLFRSGLFVLHDFCNESADIHDLEFAGVVVEKIPPAQLHKGKYLIINSDSGSRSVKLDLLLDKNVKKQTDKQLWKMVNVGDSVIKQKRSFVVRYKNVNSDWKRVRLGYDLCP